MSSSQPALDIEAIENSFRNAVQGILEPVKIEAAVASLRKTSQAHDAFACVESLIFYLLFVCKVKNGQQFDGQAGGISIPGLSEMSGFVYTDDIERLYRDTRSFMFICELVFTSLLFFDSDSNLLGHFEGASVGTVAGKGGGTGEWRNKG